MSNLQDLEQRMERNVYTVISSTQNASNSTMPIKCQVCPHFYSICGKWQCQRVRCELIDNEKLRKQVYDVIKALNKE